MLLINLTMMIKFYLLKIKMKRKNTMTIEFLSSTFQGSTKSSQVFKILKTHYLSTRSGILNQVALINDPKDLLQIQNAIMMGAATHAQYFNFN